MIDLRDSEDLYINDIDRQSVVEPTESTRSQEAIFFIVMFAIALLTYYTDFK